MTLSLIPETAPFSIEQRGWLNGFLSGWLGIQSNGHAPPASITSALLPAPEPAPAETAEEFAWHDPNLEIDDRLKLADGKPLNRRLMAAMAQLDCGACGYVCQTYSEAIASGSEKNLTLCSPGGKQTAKTVKRLLKEEASEQGAAGEHQKNGVSTNGQASTDGHVSTNGHSSTNGHAATNGSSAVNGGASTNGKASTNGHAAVNGRTSAAAYSRSNPFLARLKSSTKINKGGSSKHTSHVVIDLSGLGSDYRVGDALGIYPTNAPELVDAILDAAHLSPDESAPAPDGKQTTCRMALTNRYCLSTVPEDLMGLLARAATDEAERAKVEAALVDESYEQFDVLDAMLLAPSARIRASEFFGVLTPLAPRLYSIASSLKAHPNEVHLTVGRVEYEKSGRKRLGVASTMFADRAEAGTEIGVFVHAASDFTIPADPTAPMIMVGPGTGIAPFRAFLQERHATGATGKNWLFFGDQSAATDFLYQEELATMLADGFLTRLDTAFSRDQAHKIYVQDRMRENAAELFQWLEAGGYFFVCGDAKRMAADVDRALHDVVATHGAMSPEQAREYVNKLKTQKRYVRDVY